MKNKYIIIDTETTGFHPYDGDELLQVSIIDTDGNVLFDEYFKPQHRTEWKEAEQVNGISPEMVADRPAISEKISEINAIIENSDTIIGYNTQFDIGFLKANGAIVPDDIDTIDVMEDFAEIYGERNSFRDGYKWQKLTTAADYYGYDWSQRAETAHNSLGDCYATLFVYNKINSDTMIIERVIDGKRVGIELTPAEISQAYCIKENDDRRQDILNALDEMDSLKIGNIELSKDFLKNSNLFISDVIYRYEKMDDHLEDYNMAIEDVLDNADKNYAGKLVSHYAQNMSLADKEQYIESAEMAMDWNDTNEPAISRLEYMLYTTLITERDFDKIRKDCLKAPKNKTGEYIDGMIKTMRTEAKVYFIEGIDEDRKNGVEISELDNIVYDKLVEDRLIREDEVLNYMATKQRISDIAENCRNACELCDKQSQNDIFLSEEQVVQAVKLGIPVGYVTKQEGHHGSSAGLHTFYMLSEQNYSALTNDSSMDKGPVFHYTMTEEQKKEMLDIINAAIEDPCFAEGIEKLKRDDDIGFKPISSFLDDTDDVLDLTEKTGRSL